MRKLATLSLLSALALGACVSAVPEEDAPGASPEGRAVMKLRKELKEGHGVELRSATVLDGINTNVLKIDMRSSDKTLEERVTRAQQVARYLREKGVIPAGHHRVAFDFPVSFQVGCMPVNLYERVQLELTGFTPIQKLPAQRVLANDNLTRGQMGQVILDDTQWNIPFFVKVDAVEIANEVQGVTAKPDEVFVSVHAVWTNIGRNVATMTDDPWRLVEASGKNQGELVALLDGGETHLARNGGRIKMPPVDPGKSQARWYVYRVPRAKLGGALAFARQRYAKATTKDPKWTKAGFELWVQIKSSHALSTQPQPAHPLMVYADDWRGAVDATLDTRAMALRAAKL